MTLAAFWAYTEFTAENGATLVAPGSHLWAHERKPEDHELVQAVMPRGSALLFTGGTLHGGGHNTTTDQFRKTVATAYSMGWLMPEMRFWPYKPLRESIDQLSPTLRDLLGFGEQHPTGVSQARISEEATFNSEAVAGGQVDEN